MTKASTLISRQMITSTFKHQQLQHCTDKLHITWQRSTTRVDIGVNEFTYCPGRHHALYRMRHVINTEQVLLWMYFFKKDSTTYSWCVDISVRYSYCLVICEGFTCVQLYMIYFIFYLKIFCFDQSVLYGSCKKSNFQWFNIRQCVYNKYIVLVKYINHRDLLKITFTHNCYHQQ